MIEAYAKNLAIAQSTLADCAAKGVTCSDTLALLQQRVDIKQQQLSALQQARLNGIECESDAALIQALQLDLAGLAPLVQAAEAQHNAAVQQQEAAQQALQQADSEWVKATADADAVALELKLRELESLFCNGLRQLHSLKCTAESRLSIPATAVYRLNQPLDRFLKYGVIPS